jgi:ArsR family transcriptional regulator
MTATSPIVSTSLVTGFHALSDPLRLMVLELLREQELCVCELCERLGTTQSKLSFHLKTLKEANLVRARQEKRWIYYSLESASVCRSRTVLGRVSTEKPNLTCSSLPRRFLTHQLFYVECLFLASVHKVSLDKSSLFEMISIDR